MGARVLVILMTYPATGNTLLGLPAPTGAVAAPSLSPGLIAAIAAILETVDARAGVTVLPDLTRAADSPLYHGLASTVTFVIVRASAAARSARSCGHAGVSNFGEAGIAGPLADVAHEAGVLRMSYRRAVTVAVFVR